MKREARGHIIEAEITKRDEDDELGVRLNIWPVGKKPGYGIPRGEYFFVTFDQLRLMVSDISRPKFENHHDMMGVEVAMIYQDDKLVEVAVVQEGAKRIYPETETARNAREKKEGIVKDGDDGMRSRRFYACRAREENRLVIEALPIPEARKNELLNLNIVLTRMVLAENDGQLSVQKLQVF